MATEKADSAESSEATPEAAKADQTNRDNANKSVESSEATPEAAKADQTTEETDSAESSEAIPEAAQVDHATQDNVDNSAESLEASPLARNNQQKTPVVCSPRFPSIEALLLDALHVRQLMVQQHVSTGLAVCSICMDCGRPSIMVLVPCGHVCICQKCSHHAQHSCPICLTATTNMVRTNVS